MLRKLRARRYRGTLSAVSALVAIGVVLGVLSVMDESCGQPNFREAIIGVALLFVAGLMWIGGLLVLLVGWWRHEPATIRSGVGLVLMGAGLVGGLVVATSLASPCG